MYPTYTDVFTIETNIYHQILYHYILFHHNIYLLKTPPRRDALRHSGCDSRLLISPTVTLYFDVELRRDRRPGTQQNTSEG